MTYADILEIPPFQLDREGKGRLMTDYLVSLTRHHYERCDLYRNILDGLDCDFCRVSHYRELPFLPVRLFKELDLKSIPDSEIFKTMTSSGTSGQKVSKIFLDRATSANQQKTLVNIVKDFTGASRMPMLIIDSPEVIKNREMFSARGAGILGFSIFAAQRAYALDKNMNLDLDGIKSFLETYKGKPILLFGFTFMIWQHFYRELEKLKISLDLSNGILIHGGGWKKLEQEAVSAEEFRTIMYNNYGLSRIHNYYGMVEQTGCVYMECECGHLHASVYSDVLIRRPKDFALAEIGEPGIIQVLSMLPESYPGQSILTEDVGVILGEDDCPCGRLGKYFAVHGRIRNAEIRGCSDTYEQT